jgi:hypothetical protein
MKGFIIRCTLFFRLCVLFALVCAWSCETRQGAAAPEEKPGGAAVIQKKAEPEKAAQTPREHNAAYLREKLGPLADEPWFADMPEESGFFYFIAVSGKAAAEQRARTNAQNEARRLLNLYSPAAGGRGIEVTEWKTFQGVSPEGTGYYIACAKTRARSIK